MQKRYNKMNDYYTYTFYMGLYILFYFIASTEPFEQYKNIAQPVGEGVHSTRIFGLALVDVTATILLALVICFFSYRYLKKKISFIYFINVFIFLVFISVPVHMLFGVNTALIQFFNGKAQNQN